MFGERLFELEPGVKSRWASHENPDGEKGAGGKARGGRKGAAWFTLENGEDVVLAHAEGTSGMIRRIWITINTRNEATLRGTILEMYWDGMERPAVRAPIGDFFCHGIGRMCIVKNALFSSPEGRSFNCFIPMPFRTGMKIVVKNRSGQQIRHFYYDVDYTLGDHFDENTMYFHSFFNRENPTTMGKDFEILPRIEGRGRYLGVNLGIRCDTEKYFNTWWGEGEVKFYLDGDKEYPTICGTGTEDYFGGAWSFATQENGRTVENTYCTPFLGYPYYSVRDTEIHNDYHTDDQLPQRGFYRWHIMDPILFQKDLRVTIQQIGVSHGGLFERQDDVASVAYWYQTEPHEPFGPLMERKDRWPR